MCLEVSWIGDGSRRRLVESGEAESESSLDKLEWRDFSGENVLCDT